MFSHILSNKLSETNQKAKYFEEANILLEDKVIQRTSDLEIKTDELLKSHQKLETQNLELHASYYKIEELYSAQEVTINKLDELYNDQLSPLTKSLQSLKDSLHADIKPLVLKTINRIQSVTQLIKPISVKYSSEKNIRDKHILFADSEKKQQVLAKMALGGTGLNLSLASSTEEGEALLKLNKFHILFVSSDTLSLAKYAFENFSDIKIVYITSKMIPEYLSKINEYPFIENIVSRDKSDNNFTIKNIMITVTKLVSQDIFGLSKYLSWGSKIQKHKVTGSQQRYEIINNMSAHFTQLGMRKSTLERCRMVAEELLMNAIYDAPTDENGNSIYNHLPRTEPVSLNENQESLFRFGTDGIYMGISIQDPFGSLKINTVLKYLNTCYSGQESSTHTHKGGAGRGLHQIIEGSDLTVFNVNTNHKTEVIALFSIDPKNASESPSFNYFIKTNSLT